MSIGAARSAANPALSRVGHIAAVAVIYFGVARLGLVLAFQYKNVSPVWPPSGVAIACLIMLGPRVWPGIALGAFLANFSTHLPPLVAACIAIGNTMEALLATWILEESRRFKPTLSHVQDV